MTLREITCDCTAADKCPAGKTGSQSRCTILVNTCAFGVREIKKLKTERDNWKDRYLQALSFVPGHITMAQLMPDKLKEDG